MIGSHPVGGARGGRGGGRGHGAAPRLPAGLLVLGPRLPHHHVLRGPDHHLRRRQDAGPVRLPGHRGQARGLGGHLQLAVNSTFVFTLNWIQVGPTAEGANLLELPLTKEAAEADPATSASRAWGTTSCR